MIGRWGASLLALLAGCGPLAEASPNPSGPASPPAAGIQARVVSVVDGDTVRVEVDGQVLRLRYIGIDAPERGTPYADQATAANARLVAGRRVLLERDVSDTDRFDRLLRYVWVERDGSWVLVNRELVRLGLAVARRYPPDTGRHQDLEDAEREARQAGSGIWAGQSGRSWVPGSRWSGVLPSVVGVPAGVAERQTQPA